MNPLALSTFIGRVGPWLGRQVAASPGLLATVVSRLKTGGKFVGERVSDIVAWAKANPGNAVLLSTTLASLGLSVSELFGDKHDDPETFSFQLGLDEISEKARASMLKVADESEKLAIGSEPSVDEKAHREVVRETLSWAVGFFGNRAAAKRAHIMLQAFVELPRHDVEYGLDNLILSGRG